MLLGNILKIMAHRSKVNPWAVCHSSTGPEKTAKFERCVRKVKRKHGIHENILKKFVAGMRKKFSRDPLKHLPWTRLEDLPPLSPRKAQPRRGTDPKGANFQGQRNPYSPRNYPKNPS